ncbi:DUF1430 domain-containing protein [Staphylococcus shinii]|uniref:DUF1430 domain-containing protein n=1 Tax=Staphylococcus shinii TaxID=2912228 RepID=UPI003CF7BF06
MKVFKFILDVITLCLVSTLILIFTLREADDLIPGSSNIIHISTWDRTFNKKDIFNTIEKISKQENISIYKLIRSPKTGKTKYLYLFNGNVTSIQKKKGYQSINYEALLSKDVRGDYYIIGDTFNPNNLKQQLHKKGLEVTIYHINKPKLFISIISDKGLLYPIISLFFIYVLYFFHKTINTFKAYSIKQIHGYRLPKIILENTNKTLIYYCSLICISLLISLLLFKQFDIFYSNTAYLTRSFIGAVICFGIIFLIYTSSYILLVNNNIPQAIKGKKPYKFMHTVTIICKAFILFILVYLLIINLNTYDSIKKIKETESLCSHLNDYYIIELSPFKYTELEEKEIAKKFHNLVKETEEKHESILIRNNNLYQPSLKNYSPDNGNVIFVNNHFVSLYKGVLQKYLNYANTKNNITLLLPPTAQTNSIKVKNDFEDWIQFQQGILNQQYDLKLIPVNHNYEVYTFDTKSHLKNTFSKNPIVILLDTNILGDSFYFSSVTQGSYLFKNYQVTTDYLKTYELSDVVSGVTNYKEMVLNDFKELNTRFIVVSISIILSIITLFLTIIFDTQQYFENNLKLLVVRKIHGYNLVKNNINYLFFSNCLVIAVGIFSWWTLKHNLVIFLFILFLILQITIQIIYIKRLEKSNIIKLKE